MGCFKSNKDPHAASQLRFLEEQNVELASALNEWQALSKQLQEAQGILATENSNLQAQVEQHQRTIGQQASDARISDAESRELRQLLDEARAQCHEVQLLWEGSVNECSQLDSQLATEQQKVSELEEQVEGFKSDKAYLMEALERREKALRMAEQVMDMVDMMQTTGGPQDLSGFNWGPDDLDGFDAGGGNPNASSGACGQLKGVLGAGLDDAPKHNHVAVANDPGQGPAADFCASPRVGTGPQASQEPGGATDSHLPPRSSQFQLHQQQMENGGSAEAPSVQRSQSPDMRNMGLRRSIQATKLVLAQSRTSSMTRPSSAPEAKEVEQQGSKRKAETGSTSVSASRAKVGASPNRSARSSKDGRSAVKKSCSSNNLTTQNSCKAPSSTRSSSSSCAVGVTGHKGGVQASGAEVAERGGAPLSRANSARSSRKSVSACCEAQLAGSGSQPGPHQEAELRTPPTSYNGLEARRGSSSGVLDSLVGSVVYDAMGPSPIHSSTHGNNSLASSGAGALMQQGQQQACSLEASMQYEQQQGAGVTGKAGSAAAGATKLLGGVSSWDAAHLRGQHGAPAQIATGSLAHMVAMAMHSPQDSTRSVHKDWLQQQQQQLLGEDVNSTGGSSHRGSADNSKDTSLNGSLGNRGSADRDTSLLRYNHGDNGRGSSSGSGLLPATAGARKVPSVRGPNGVLSGSSRPSPLKLGAKQDAIRSSKDDAAREVDQIHVAVA